MTTPIFTGSQYLPPGVYTEAVSGPQVAIFTTAPTAVAIFGDTVRYRTYSDIFTVPDDAAGPTPEPFGPLTKLGANDTTFVVRNINTGVIYEAGTDYTVTQDTGDDATPDTRDDSYTFTRELGGSLLEGDVVQISYQYTDAEFFDPQLFLSSLDLQDAYGPAFDDNGSLVSELTLAGQIAFANGASRVLAVAVDAASSTPTVSEYEEALEKFEDNEEVAIIVPATGLQTLFAAVSSHVNLQSTNRHERRAIVARDGSSTAVSSATRISNAQAIANRRVMMASPATVTYFVPQTQSNITLGGQFLAAALAGITVSQVVSVPLTRKTILGFVGIPETLSEQQKSLEAVAGLCVIEQQLSGQIRVRHGVTTDPTSLYTREWTLTGQEDALGIQLRNYLDAEGLIGSVITDTTLATLKGSTSGALERLIRDRVIRSYQSLQVRQLVSSPDVMQVQFEWKASIPFNYIYARYSVNLSTGEVLAA